MMRAAMSEAASEGWALAGLYASTQALYRQVGFEQAGDRCAISLRLPTLGMRERGTAIQPIGETDFDAVRACYTNYARQFDGPLDRGTYIWNRIKARREKVYQGFATRNQSGEIDGYLYFTQYSKDSGKFDLELSDFAATNADAFRRLIGFLADFAMMADVATFHAGPHHPALMLLPQQSFEIKHQEFWMLRILNVKRALEARGWLPSIDATAELELHDDLVSANNGRFVVRVKDGFALVEPGGSGAVAMDVRGLAPLFTGLQDVKGLVLAGLVKGSDAAIASASRVFPKGSPWTGDFY
jgi:predicted acetyltransferase